MRGANSTYLLRGMLVALRPLPRGSPDFESRLSKERTRDEETISAGREEGQRKRVFSRTTSSTKLFADDYKTVDSLAAAWGETTAGVIRIIVHDWLRSQRVRALGRDETTEQVRAVYERVVSEQVAPLAAAVRGLKHLLENP